MNRKNKLFELENRLKNIINLTDENQNELIKNEIKIIEKELSNIYQLKAHGAQIRSRSEIIESDESKSKLFFGLEKTNQTRKVMHSLNIDGKKITNNKEILQHEVKFYQNLYSSENTYVENINSYLSETTQIIIKDNKTEL